MRDLILAIRLFLDEWLPAIVMMLVALLVVSGLALDLWYAAQGMQVPR